MLGSWKLGWSDVVSRIFAVVAAIFFVAAVATAMLAPPAMPLGHVLFALDQDLGTRMMYGLQDAMRNKLPEWLSSWVISPVLLRPAWLLPATIGLVAAGLSLSFPSRASTDHARR